MQTTRADVYERRRVAEVSLMAKGIFASAVRESQEALGEEPIVHRGRMA